MITEQEFRQIVTRRGSMLKLIRQGHEQQLERMNDSQLQELMRDIRSNMSSRQVMTMLQDLQMLNYLTFELSFSDELERYVAKQIMLTAAGTALVARRVDTDEVRFS